ncbi:E3 ubiquitin-protein ligase CHIP-like [Bolinopsis microptera]|uniref:E3 ubiquitin-protein ligase CHIP-like n=1 Tax=Bolinopsis microptera TaxID=2820187 RepID=UPI00307A2D57
MNIGHEVLELKQQGNKFFSQRSYEEAISCYTKALLKNDKVTTIYTNRALCYLKLELWDRVLRDCKLALEIDKMMTKAHFFMGQALTELGKFDEAISSYHTAIESAKSRKEHFGDDLHQALRRTKKKKLLKEEEKRMSEEIELQTLLTKLLIDDLEKKKNQEPSDDEVVEIDKHHEDLEAKYTKYIDTLNYLFSELDDRRRRREVPDYLCGKISFEIMKEPVITPSGVTYERSDLEEHLQRVGHFDPLTRVPLKREKLTPNLAMREVIEHFLENNPWAEYY